VPRIYTRTGDKGETGLIDGSRTSKADPRVDLYGDVDELNSAIGVALAAPAPSGEEADELRRALAGVQVQLFELGALLADPARCARLAGGEAEAHPVEGAALEPLIDALDAPLPPLRAFILPGGEAMAASLHLARTICRRAERKAVDLRGDAGALPESVIVFLNRLSDLLFVAARRANQVAGREDVLWSGRRADP
jgi:cob(I)alamin adenosyltransferase